MDKTTPSAATHLRWYGLTHRGKVRKNNEDSFLCLRFDAQEVQYLGKVGDSTLEHHDYTFAVSDGMGGALAGEFASRITVEKITRLLPKSYKLSASGLEAGFGDVLAELFTQIHQSLTAYGRHYPECAGMGATLSLAWFTPGRMFFGHVGDSRIYHHSSKAGTFTQVTHDDTYVGWMYRQGQLNEREARNHPRKNVLQKALGGGHQFVDPQVGAVPFEPGDSFLLCTDGLNEGLFDARLEEILQTRAQHEENPTQRLIDSSLALGGRDNLTAVVIEIL